MKKLAILAISAAVVLPALALNANSGLKPGENVTPFHPSHVSGPLANTTNCFPCTFQNRPQVQVWVNGDDMANVLEIAKVLDSSMSTYKKSEFKGLVVVVADKAHQGKISEALKAAAKKPGLSQVGMAVIDKENEAVGNYKINLDSSVKNTVFVYKNWKVTNSFVNLKAAQTGDLKAAIAKIAE